MKEKKEKKKPNRFEKWFAFMRRVHKFLIYPIFPYKKYGHTERFNDRAYIFVCNHKSIMDVVLPVMATDKPVHFMAKKELFEKGVAKWFTAKCECIPVSRDGTDVRALMTAMKYLKNGEHVVVFPEGTRNKTEAKFLPFKSGAAALSIKTRTPIIPIVQIKKIKAFRKSKVFYGEPFEFSDYYDKKITAEDIEECDGILLNKFNELYAELESVTDKRKK